MPESMDLRKSPPVIVVKELDQSIWHAWKARNAIRERQRNTARLNAVKYASLALLLIATYLWEYVGPYQVVIRFALSVGALVVVGQAWRSRRYGLAAAFVAMTVIFNPVVAILPTDGGWPFPVVFLAILTFGASLVWLQEPSGDQSFVGSMGSSPAKTERSNVKTELASWENEGGAAQDPELLTAIGERKGAGK